MADFKPNIWRLQAQFDTQGLIKALAHSDPVIRKGAATALRTLGASAAIPALQSALSSEQDADTQSAIATALEHLMNEANREAEQSPEVSRIIRLIAQLSSLDEDAVTQAARALGELKNKSAVEPLVMLFHNTHKPTRARLAAAEALINLDSAPAEVTLLVGLRSDKWYIRRNSAAILGQLRANWAVEPLAQALRDEHELVRKTALAALKRIATPEALRIVRLLPQAAEVKPSAPATTTLSQSDETLQVASRAATKPLDPRIAEEAEARRSQQLQQQQQGQQPAAPQPAPQPRMESNPTQPAASHRAPTRPLRPGSTDTHTRTDDPEPSSPSGG